MTGQKLEMDADVQAVVEFMQLQIPTSKLVAVAKGLNGIAPLLWGHHKQEELLAISVKPFPISAEPNKQLAANE